MFRRHPCNAVPGAFLLCLAAALAQAAPAVPSTSKIVIENRTYLPTWYRTSGGGSWGNWMPLLPGDRHNYSRQARLTVEVTLPGAKQQFTLQGGNTYYYGLAAGGKNTRFALDPQDKGRGAWHRPQPPEASEFTTGARRPGASLFGPLEQFVERSKHYGDEYKLSLAALAAECREAEDFNPSTPATFTGLGSSTSPASRSTDPLPPELRRLKGFTWFFGYVLDQRNKDIILLGVKDPCRPPLDIDCLATAIKAVQEGNIPACSLDSHPDERYQKSVIRGVPWNTKWAEVMIDADYLMKKVCQGQINPGIKGLTSDWDYSYWLARNDFKTGNTRTEDRWWFNFDSSQDRGVVSPRGDAAVLYRNPVRISTEKKIQGEYGTGVTSQSAELFAADFSRNMETLGKHYQSVGQLLALYRLYDLMCHVERVGHAHAPQAEYWTAEYERPYTGPPAAMPTLSRKQVYKWKTPGYTNTLTKSVKGGVDMAAAVTPQTLQYAELSVELNQQLLASE